MKNTRKVRFLHGSLSAAKKGKLPEKTFILGDFQKKIVVFPHFCPTPPKNIASFSSRISDKDRQGARLGYE